MTTQFFTKADGFDDSPLYNSGCFGSTKTHFIKWLCPDLLKNPRDASFLHKFTHRAYGLTNLELWMPVGDESPLQNSGQREEILTIFHEMWHPLLKDQVRYEGKTGPLKDSNIHLAQHIVYTANAPVQLLVNSAATLRIFAWQHDFCRVYNLLKNIEKQVGMELPPLARYAIASGLSVSGDDPEPLGKEGAVIRMLPKNSHMPVPHSLYSTGEDVVWTTGWTYENYRNGRVRKINPYGDELHSDRLPNYGFKESLWSQRDFCYKGRDKFFVGKGNLVRVFIDPTHSWIVSDIERLGLTHLSSPVTLTTVTRPLYSYANFAGPTVPGLDVHQFLTQVMKSHYGY